MLVGGLVDELLAIDYGIGPTEPIIDGRIGWLLIGFPEPTKACWLLGRLGFVTVILKSETLWLLGFVKRV